MSPLIQALSEGSVFLAIENSNRIDQESDDRGQVAEIWGNIAYSGQNRA